jgi:hypothetical protein
MSVTDARYFSAKSSRSRNDGWGASLEAHTCHWCREPFKPEQMRYPVTTDCSRGWALVSLCMDCFKRASAEETHEKRQGRHQRKCAGCGEPMLTPIYRPFHNFVCSTRCYQRVYRKRRHEGHGSTVPWKAKGPFKCKACKKPLPDGQRRDARFCSNACRQRAYRQRRCRARSQN